MKLYARLSRADCGLCGREREGDAQSNKCKNRIVYNEIKAHNKQTCSCSLSRSLARRSRLLFNFFLGSHLVKRAHTAMAFLFRLNSYFDLMRGAPKKILHKMSITPRHSYFTLTARSAMARGCSFKCLPSSRSRFA
jgi:hypothetical protein